MPMKLGIKTDSGKLIVLPNVLETDTVKNIREQLAKTRNATLQEITLKFQGKLLDDDTMRIGDIPGFIKDQNDVPGSASQDDLVRSEAMSQFMCFKGAPKFEAKSSSTHKPLPIKLGINTDSGKLIVLPDILESDTVKSIREELAKTRNATLQEITLTFQGKLLDDDTMCIGNIPGFIKNQNNVPGADTPDNIRRSAAMAQFKCYKSAAPLSATGRNGFLSPATQQTQSVQSLSKAISESDKQRLSEYVDVLKSLDRTEISHAIRFGFQVDRFRDMGLISQSKPELMADGGIKLNVAPSTATSFFGIHFDQSDYAVEAAPGNSSIVKIKNIADIDEAIRDLQKYCKVATHSPSGFNPNA